MEEVDVVRARLLATTARIEDIVAEIWKLSKELDPLRAAQTNDRAVLDPEHTVPDPGNGMATRQEGVVGSAGRLDIPEIKHMIASFTPTADVRALAHSSLYWSFLYGTPRYRISVLMAYASGAISPKRIPAGTQMAYANKELCVVYKKHVEVRPWKKFFSGGPHFGSLGNVANIRSYTGINVRKILAKKQDFILLECTNPSMRTRSATAVPDARAFVINEESTNESDVHIRGDANTVTHAFTLKEEGADVYIHIEKDGKETGSTYVCPQIAGPVDHAVVLVKPDLMYVLYGNTVYTFRGGKKIPIEGKKGFDDTFKLVDGKVPGVPGLDVGDARCLDVFGNMVYVGMDTGVAVYQDGREVVFIQTSGPVCEIAAAESVLFVHHKFLSDRPDVILAYSNPPP
jgi:hypothetical protein